MLRYGVVMARLKMRRTYTPNQVVAYNVGRARALRGWTQEQAAGELSHFLEKRWSRASYSAVERSVGGGRVKQFSADELVALARGFRLPVLWFFLPPPLDDDPGLHVPHTTSRGIEMTELMDIVFGTSETITPYEEALRGWAAQTMDQGLVHNIEQHLATINRAETDAAIGEAIGDVSEAQEVLRNAAEILGALRRIIKEGVERDDTNRDDPAQESG